MLKRLFLFSGFLAGMSAIACSDRSADIVAPFRQNAVTAGDSVFIHAGNAQVGRAGVALPKALQVRVTNAGVPVADARGTFAVTAGGGSVSRVAFRTNDAGIAQFKWTLGASGPQQVTASLNSGNSATFSATVIPVGSTLSIVSGNGQAALPGDTLAGNLFVELRDPLGSVIQGATVRFTTISAHGGAVKFATRTTNTAGRALNRWMLGWGASEQTLRAFVPGVDTVVFNATASTAGISFQVLSGAGQTANVGSDVSLVVQLKKNGVPVEGVRGSFGVIGGGGMVNRNSFTTNALGRGSVTWTLGTASPAQQLGASIGAVGGISASATANQGTFITRTSRSEDLIMSRYNQTDRQFDVSWRVSSTVHIMGVSARLIQNGNRTIGGLTPQQVSCSGAYNIGAGIHDETCTIMVPHGAASGDYDIEFVAGADTVFLSDTLGITIDDTDPLTIDDVILPRSVVSLSEPALGGGYRVIEGFRIIASSVNGIEYMSAAVNHPSGHPNGGCSWPAFIPEYPNPANRTCDLAVPGMAGTYDLEVQVFDRAQNRKTYKIVGAITVTP